MAGRGARDGTPKRRIQHVHDRVGIHESRIFEPPREFVAQANVKKADYDALNASAATDFAGFWAKLARDELLWHKPFTKTLDESNAPFYKWFEDGELNVSYNCLDRNLSNGNADKVAIIFEADDGAVTKVTYRELYHRVCRLANGLKSLGIRRATASSSTFRCRSRASSRCRRARASARPTRSCSAASRPSRCRSASSMPARWR